MAAVAATGVQPIEQDAGALVGDLVPLATRDVAERLSGVALADAGRTDQEHVLGALDEPAGGQFAQRRRVDGRVEGEVERLQGLVRGEAALAEPASELLELTPLDLVGEQRVEQLGVAPLLGHRLLQAFGEGVEHAGELEAGQLGFQQGDLIHDAAPARRWWRCGWPAPGRRSSRTGARTGTASARWSVRRAVLPAAGPVR